MNENKDRGSIAVLTILVLTALLGFGSLCTDVAILYAEKSNLQNAVDAAALAGSQELPNNPQSAITKASEYATANNTILTSVIISADNKEINVTAQKDVSLYLARVLGIESKIVGASARAAIFSPNSLKGVVPLCITNQNFSFGEEYNLKSAPENDSGWFGPLRIDGQGSPVYESALAYGSNTSVAIGDIIEVESGNMSGPTQSGLATRLNSDTRIPRNTFEDHDRDAPQIMYIPVVEVVSHSGNSIHEVEVVGFAAFFVEDYTGSGNDSFIRGRFLQTLVSSGREDSSLGSIGETNDFGLSVTKLMMD